ncbi:MAG: hypothetical protein IK048_01795 [Clostridia bacterium]|nr:hypothetical protein [Clostridia bacterium]
MKAFLEKIENDLFDVANRLKEIDPRYELYRNRRERRFEIYAQGVLQIAVPFDRLDARTLKLARETRMENAERLLRAIEEENARLDEKKRRDFIEDCLAKAEV